MCDNSKACCGGSCSSRPQPERVTYHIPGSITSPAIERALERSLRPFSYRPVSTTECPGNTCGASPSESQASDPKSLIAEYSGKLESVDLCSFTRATTRLMSRVNQDALYWRLHESFEPIIWQLVHGLEQLLPTTGDLEITVQVSQCQPQSDNTSNS